VVVESADEGLLVVDTGAPNTGEALVAALKSISRLPVTTIVNTSADADHIGANELLATTGTDRGGNAPGNSGFRISTAPVIAHENMLRRVSAPTGETPALPFAAWPTSTYFTDKKTLFYGEEPIEIISVPNAHTDGDSIVFFRRSDVIAAGDIFTTDRFPVIDVARGGTTQGMIDGLNRIIDLAIPRFNQQGGTLVVPGHGRIGNESDVVEYRDMLVIVRDRIRLMISRGMSLEAVKAARPTLDYDGVYGASNGPWTTDMFVEAVYRDLSRSR
jgi:glyoxylase-like metal-dependent hydrolase (beta-lactamase superfamily II)